MAIVIQTPRDVVALTVAAFFAASSYDRAWKLIIEARKHAEAADIPLDQIAPRDNVTAKLAELKMKQAKEN